MEQYQSGLDNLPTRNSTHSDAHLPCNLTSGIVGSPSHAPACSNPQFTVFISHAGEDKATIALPLRQKLLEHGITAIVDEADMPVGTEAPAAMIDAMETANIAVIVLSPEFVARKWPMKELMCFLRRREECIGNGGGAPIVIPFFFRLKIEELYDEPRLDRRDKDGNLLYHTSRFYERQDNDEPEANIVRIKEALESVHRIMGLRNDVDASNEPSFLMSKRRDILLRELCDKVRKAVVAKSMKKRRTGRRDDRVFQAHFDTPYEISELVFDFDCKDKNGKASTQEGKVLEMLRDRSKGTNRSIGVRGIGGVGKTSLLRGIRNLERVRERFIDGVYNVDLGMHATRSVLTEGLSLAVQSSGGEETADVMRTEADLQKVIETFRSWFAKKQCLFVIDDIWETKEVTSKIIHELLKLHVSGRDSKVLLTTRSIEIASRADTCFCLKPRSALEYESRRILFRYSKIEPKQDRDEDQRIVDEILERCCGLPLFLAVAGKAVRALSFRDGHEGCVAYHIYAESLKSSMASLVTTDIGSYEGLRARLMICIELLEQRKKEFGFRVKITVAEMHKRLSVFTKQARVPMTALMHLWELASRRQASDVAREFEQVGLAEVEFERRENGPVEVLRLHDSVYEFSVVETQKHGEEKVGHETLLEGYSRGLRMRDGCHEWWDSDIEREEYIHANLCRHLLNAGRRVEVIYLLLSPEWAERQVRKNGILFLESDSSLVMTAVKDEKIEVHDKEDSEVREVIQLISEAVSLSSGFVSRNARELWFQLHGRLQGYCESNGAIREYVSRIERDGEKPFILCKTNFLGEPGTSNTRIVFIGSPVWCLVNMKDGERFAYGCSNGEIALVNVKTSTVENQWEAHNSAVRAIAITKDGTRLISCSNDTTAKVWGAGTGRLVTCFTDHSNTVTGVAVMKDERRVISVSWDGTARIWNLETGQNLSKSFAVHDDFSIKCVTVLGGEENVVITGGSDNKLRIWNVRTGAQIGGTFDGHDASVLCVAVTPDGRYIVSGSEDCTARVWDIRSRKQVGSSLQGHSSYVSCVAVSEDGRRIASGSSDSMIRVWDLESQTEICDPLEVHADGVDGVSFVGDVNDVIASCSHDSTVRVWDVTRKNKKLCRNRHEETVWCVSFSPNRRFVVSGSSDNTIRIWDATSGQQVGDPLEGHFELITDVAVTPNGRFIVSVSHDETVRVWDLESRELLHTFTGHTDRIYCVAVTRQGDRAVTGSDDKSVGIWDLEAMNGGHVVLVGHPDALWRVFVSDDGLRAVSVRDMGNIFVWELETKKLVKQLERAYAGRLSRRQVLHIVGETTAHDDTTLSIPLDHSRVWYGEGTNETILGTVDCPIQSWALSPDKKTICLGLDDGQVALLKLER